MNKAIEVLYNEHEVIKSVINYRDKLAGCDPVKYKETVKRLIDFFRNYADKFHHYKEEKLLFPLMCEKNEMLEDSLIQEMLENHRDFRELVRSIESDVESDDYKGSNEQLFKYTEMLLDHIAVEDDELFQMADMLFDEDELEKLYFDFEDIDRELGLDKKTEYEKIGKALA